MFTEIKGPSRIPTEEYVMYVKKRAEVLHETPEQSKERLNRLMSIVDGRMDVVSQELKLDLAPGINRVPLTYEKRFEHESEACRLLGKNHPLAQEYLQMIISPEYQYILEKEKQLRELGILQRGL